MTDVSALGTIALRCPACGERLRGPRGDIVFFCDACGVASEATRQGLARRTVTSMIPAGGTVDGSGRRMLQLPMWRFCVEISYAGESPEAVERLGRLVRPDYVWVPAFRQRSMLLFGDMGLLMTWAPPGMASGPAVRFSGATLPSSEAERFLEPMVLWRADQIHDVTRIELSVTSSQAEIVTIPAVLEGSTIVDLVRDKQWPIAAFLDADSLLWSPG